MKLIELEYRMYGLVPYNLSPIQQAIQFGHAVQEFNNKIQDIMYSNLLTKDSININSFLKWSREDKTFIILNGGTTNTKGDPRLGHGGTLNQHLFTLSDNEVDVATFYEPDLGDQLTAVVFLVDERVWNREKYPDFVPTNGLIRDITRQRGYDEWVESIGGSKNEFLRQFLKQFKLA